MAYRTIIEPFRITVVEPLRHIDRGLRMTEQPHDALRFRSRSPLPEIETVAARRGRFLSLFRMRGCR